MDTNHKPSLYPALINVFMLLFAMRDIPYDYYVLLKFVVTITAIYYIYNLYRYVSGASSFWLWGLVIIAILFNPLIPVVLRDKSSWDIIDIFVLIFFVGLLAFVESHNRKHQA